MKVLGLQSSRSQELAANVWPEQPSFWRLRIAKSTRESIQQGYLEGRYTAKSTPCRAKIAGDCVPFNGTSAEIHERLNDT